MTIEKLKGKMIRAFHRNFDTVEIETPQSNVVELRDPSGLKTKDEVYAWIKEGIGHFKEWYQPVDFGNGVVAYATVPPNWEPQMDSLDDTAAGIKKWDYIVKKHVPDIRGKRVLDLGSSCGLFSIEMARMGAKEVIGIDRDVYIAHKSTNTPPKQNVTAQANFVKKAFELLDNTTYPITYMAHDVGQLETLALGRFDFILALNIVYHELDAMPHLMSVLSGMTDCLLLQSNLVHGGKLARWTNVPYQTESLLQNGYTQIEIDAPTNYLLPILVGKK